VISLPNAGQHPKRSSESIERQSLPTSRLPTPIELCERLEARGIATWSQGEGLLQDLQRQPNAEHGLGLNPSTLLCNADATGLLGVLPHAVVTASQERRLTQATASGPIDILPIGGGRLKDILIGFGLGPLAFAYRRSTGQWSDPADMRAKFRDGILDLANSDPNPFTIAPRRYWIAARLASQFRLEPSAGLLAAARDGLAEALPRLSVAAPARREIHRILLCPDPDPRLGLGFLHDSGISPALFPGLKRSGEKRVSQLGETPAFRWAAWLEGTATQRAIVRLRMPHALARQIEKISRAHPIDRTIESLRDGGTRKILQRLDQEDVKRLILWRRLDLADAIQDEETKLRSKRLDQVEAQFAKHRLDQERNDRVRSLALGGQAVMDALAAGPGAHVGRALAHLAEFVSQNPDANEPNALAAELDNWAAKDRNRIESD
jgi:hypothetical protein